MIGVSLDDPNFGIFVVVTVCLIIVAMEVIAWCWRRNR